MGSLSNEDDEFNPEINTTPLVDVMLVLLIIFIITIPVINHSVKIDLPRAAHQPNDARPEHINLSLDGAGALYWNKEQIDEAQLADRIAAEARRVPQPELHLRAERTTQYERIVKVMAAVQAGGLSKIGFVTDPQSR